MTLDDRPDPLPDVLADEPESELPLETQLRVINQKAALRVGEVALLTSMSKREVYDLLNARALKGIRGAGNKWIVPRAALDAYLQSA